MSHDGGVAPWRLIGDIFAEDISNASWQHGLLHTPAKADVHIVDRSTAHFPAPRFPNLSDLYRRTRSVTRRQHEFGITDDMQKIVLAPAGRLDPWVVRARIGNTRCSREQLKRIPVAGD